MSDIINNINMSIYNLSNRIASGYTQIGVFRNTTSASGTFTELTASGTTRLTLLSTSEYYTYSESGANINGYYYKYKLFTAPGTSASGFQTAAFQSNTSDLTEDTRYMIEDTADTISDYRYSIKELRRFVKIALYGLQSTAYSRRFKTDADGLITPRLNNHDKGIILLQAQIEVGKSQLMKAADTNISYSDGRGKFNNRTSEALRGLLKMLKEERNDLIAKYNRIAGDETARAVMWSTLSGVST